MEYAKCLTELDEILNYLSKEELKKIPEDIILSIKKNKDKNYIWKYDEKKELKDQNLNRKTIAILSYLNMEYLLNEEQKELMKAIYDFNEKKAEKEKAQRYKSDEIFKDKRKKENNREKVQIVEYKESIYKRIINKILSFFHKIKHQKHY